MKPETVQEAMRDAMNKYGPFAGDKQAEFILAALAATPEYQALVKDAERKECFWTSDGDDSPWEGSCGVAWIFIDGGPIENEVKYCPNCGGKLTAQTYDEAAAEDAAIDAARSIES